MSADFFSAVWYSGQEGCMEATTDKRGGQSRTHQMEFKSLLTGN